MRVHRALALARRAGCKGYDRRIIRRRHMIRERRPLRPHPWLETEMRITVEMDYSSSCALAAVGAKPECRFALIGKSRVGERKRDFGFVRNPLELALAKQWHRTDDDTPRLQHPEPACRHHRIVRAPQQNTVPWNETEILAQNGGDPVRLFVELPIAPLTIGMAKHDSLAAPALDHAVEQLGSAVHLVWIRELGDPGPVAHRPQLGWRSVVRAECVDVSCLLLLQPGALLASAKFLRTWPAITSFCTSVVPSYIRSERISR